MRRALLRGLHHLSNGIDAPGCEGRKDFRDARGGEGENKRSKGGAEDIEKLNTWRMLSRDLSKQRVWQPLASGTRRSLPVDPLTGIHELHRSSRFSQESRKSIQSRRMSRSCSRSTFSLSHLLDIIEGTNPQEIVYCSPCYLTFESLKGAAGRRIVITRGERPGGPRVATFPEKPIHKSHSRSVKKSRHYKESKGGRFALCILIYPRARFETKKRFSDRVTRNGKTILRTFVQRSK